MDQAPGSSAQECYLGVALNGSPCFPGHQECLQTPGKNGGEHAYSFLGGLLATQSMISPMQMRILFLAGRWSVRGPTHMDGVRLLSHRIASFLDYSDEKVFSFKEENA